jgi:hypothetical protein
MADEVAGDAGRKCEAKRDEDEDGLGGDGAGVELPCDRSSLRAVASC